MSVEWKLLPLYLILGAPAWSAAFLYIAFRIVRHRNPGTKSRGVTWVRVVLVGLALLLLAVFVFFIATFNPH